VTARTTRWLPVLAAAAAVAAFGLGVAIILQPAAPPPVMDQRGAVAACERYVQDRWESWKLTFDKVQVANDSPLFLVNGMASFEDFDNAPESFDWTCTVEPDGGQWRMTDLFVPNP
jgi:hypothetical protein